MKIIRFLKNWTLPVAIVTGIVAYLLYANLPVFAPTRPYAQPVVSVVQPVLIFCMLFLSFCKIDVRDLRPRRTHLYMLLFQCMSFLLIGLLIHFAPRIPYRVVWEATALCLISPTATAAAVVTQKLRGNGADVTTYTLLINLAVAVIVPLIVPLMHPAAGQTFLKSCMLILAKVFPMLILPLFAAQFVRLTLPSLYARLASVRDLAFYLWAVSLSIAIAVTTRSIAHTSCPWGELLGIAVSSLVCCILQFGLGRKMGKHTGNVISSTQGLGQKNTVFAIWMGYTFLNPATALAGGFYSIWHNLYNTYQLRQEAQQEAATTAPQSRREHNASH